MYPIKKKKRIRKKLLRTNKLRLFCIEYPSTISMVSLISLDAHFFPLSVSIYWSRPIKIVRATLILSDISLSCFIFHICFSTFMSNISWWAFFYLLVLKHSIFYYLALRFFLCSMVFSATDSVLLGRSSSRKLMLYVVVLAISSNNIIHKLSITI